MGEVGGRRNGEERILGGNKNVRKRGSENLRENEASRRRPLGNGFTTIGEIWAAR